MSRASKLTLAGMSFFAATTVGLVHFQQTIEKDAMHQGVVRDMEQLRIKQERQLDFDMQRALEAEYKKEQSVHDAIAAAEAQEGKDGKDAKAA
ncbi:cytochrome c oxidase assembly protein [Ophiostoma piceae UAMH 11346]|uniref:Cytochrome c oxidase assembly protein n=1 Tax=Ophiostoma piceae (strain UAMH 11346) TaxID=1262450 RepID=S3C3M2_OPHP1|nr:cytochrome c oxidase assembly protein [Ophiostoma piceae UAMH 11346]